MSRRGHSLLLAATLAACAGPRPQLSPALAPPVPSAWRDATATGAAPVQSDWWRTFGDPVVADLVSRALAHNDDVSTAAARVEEARGLFANARAQALPDVTLSAFGGRQRFLDPFGLGLDQTVGETDLTVAYDLDLFGRLRQSTRATKALLLASQEGQASVRLAVEASVVSGYIGLLALDERLRILRETLKARQDSLNFAQRRTAAGYAPALDIEQAQEDYRAAEQLIPQTELAIRRQEDGLSLLLGGPPSAIERGKVLDDLSLPTPVPSLPAVLLRQRPDVAQAEANVVAAERQLDAVRASFMPDISLTAAGGYVNSTVIPTGVDTFTLAGSLLAPIFDAGRRRGQQTQAAARRDQAAIQYRHAVLEAMREVEDGLAEQTRLGDQALVVDEQQNAAAKALQFAVNRYREGYSPYLEQLDAQRGLLAVELLRVQLRADRLNAAVHLYQAVGGGWSAPTVAAAPTQKRGPA